MNTGRVFFHGPLGLFLFFDVDYFAAFIMSTVRAHGVGQAHFSAIAALHQVACYQTIVGAAAITAT
jgi:hypothetical protein